MKILLVDDNTSITKMASKFFKLADGNYEVDIANNGAEGVAKYSSFQPDVVILDLAMPVMDGKETLVRILSMDKQATVIIASASGSQDTVDECLKKGARGFVEKPYSPDELLTMINNTISSGTKGTDLVTVFSLAGNKVEASLRKMIEYTVSVELKNVESHEGTYANASTYSNTDSSRVKHLDGPDTTSQIIVPEDSYGFTCEISGQVSGVVVGVIKKDDLFTMCGKEDAVVLADDEANFMEIFNILNNNMTNELAEFVGAKVERSPPRYFDAEKDSKFDGKKFTIANYEIKLGDNLIPLDFYTWH